LAVVALVAVTLLNPLGYRGGGGDDWHYLEAARCAAAHGLCPPANHWWARLPLVVPMGWAIAGGGVSRLTVGLVPFLYALAALSCFTLLVQRQFGRGAAMVAGGLLATLPVAAFSWLQPNVDVPELAFLAAALLALDQAARSARRRWALAAGALLGLAILTRPTALVALPILAVLPLLHPPLRRFILPVLLGLAAPVLLEALFYALWLGDPLASWRLSLGHAALATDELPPGFHPARGPLFNPDYIAAWRRPMGIHVHWTVDPVLNLLASPAIGLLLGGALLLLLLAPPRPGDAEGRKTLLLLGAAMLWFGALTYALAIDPKPRMFLPVAAAAAAIAGVQVMRLKARGRRLLALAVVGLVAAMSLVRIYDEQGVAALEPPARAWVAEAGAHLAVAIRRARFLALVRGVRALPVAPAADRPLLLVVGFDRCEALPEQQGRPVQRRWYREVSRGR
jgi:4-amino-4-deoxy-L-arabinose transferase-like glycosyltransferase